MNRFATRSIRTRPMAAAAALVAALVATQPLAQKGKDDDTVAKLVEMQGNVLVSRDAGLTSGVEKLRLRPGTRVITTANSQVVVEYDNGCRVKLEENEHFEVARDKECALLAALPLMATPAAVAPALAAIVIPAVIGAGSIAAIIDSRGSQAVSPS